MARLCVRIAPNSHPTDPSLDALRTQPGDVVCIEEDSHIFSVGEMTCGQYQIIDVPGVSPEKFDYLRESVQDSEGKMTKRSTKSLDLGALVGKVTEEKLALVTKDKT